MILKQLGCCENRQPFCVYVVGAGGKTSWIHFLAKQERAEGKRVLILTSTHMYEPKEWVSVRGSGECKTKEQIDQWAKEILQKLETWGVVIAGIQCGEGKITWISDAMYEKVKNGADLILIEGDGSRHLPVKVPSEKEPVIFSDADLIFVTEGMRAVGKPLMEVCHRLDEAMEILGCQKEDLVTKEAVKEMYREGYERVLEKTHPNALILPVWVYPTDGEEAWDIEKNEYGQIQGIVWYLNGIYRYH